MPSATSLSLLDDTTSHTVIDGAPWIMRAGDRNSIIAHCESQPAQLEGKPIKEGQTTRPHERRLEYRCFKCDTPGHMVKDCNAFWETVRIGRVHRKGSGRCFKCDTPGHLVIDCFASPETVRIGRVRREDSGRCFNCGAGDYRASKCPWEDF